MKVRCISMKQLLSKVVQLIFFLVDFFQWFHGSMVSRLKNVSTLELWDLFLVLKVLLHEISNHLAYPDAACTVEKIYLHVPLNVAMFT